MTEETTNFEDELTTLLDEETDDEATKSADEPEDTEPEDTEPEDTDSEGEDSLEKLLGLEDIEEEEEVNAEEEEEDSEDAEDSEEEKALLELVDEEESEEDEEIPSNWDELTKEEQDEEIFLALEDDKTWETWRESAEEVHGEVDRSFAVEALRAGYTPEFLSERGIYSLSDFKTKLEAEEGKSNEDAVILADPHDPKQVAAFKEDYFGIPSTKEGYKLDGLKGTIYEDDSELINLLLVRAEAESMTQNQFYAQAEYETVRKEETELLEKQELNRFRRDEKVKMKEIYGNNHMAIVADVLKVIKSTAAGAALYKNHKDSKVLASADFTGLLYSILTHKTSSRDIKLLANSERKVTDASEMDLSGKKIEDVVALREKLLKLKIAKDSNAFSNNPKVIARHHKVWNAINYLNDEVERRQ